MYNDRRLVRLLHSPAFAGCHEWELGVSSRLGYLQHQQQRLPVVFYIVHRRLILRRVAVAAIERTRLGLIQWVVSRDCTSQHRGHALDKARGRGHSRLVSFRRSTLAVQFSLFFAVGISAATVCARTALQSAAV